LNVDLISLVSLQRNLTFVFYYCLHITRPKNYNKYVDGKV